MKRYIAIIALFMFAGSTSAFAASLAAGFGKEVMGQKGSETTRSIGKLSNNVAADFNYDSTSYAVTTKHKNGTKEYGSSSGDTKLFYKEYTAAQTPEAPSASDSTAYNSWSSL
jgi:hypothetical protein